MMLRWMRKLMTLMLMMRCVGDVDVCRFVCRWVLRLYERGMFQARIPVVSEASYGVVVMKTCVHGGVVPLYDVPFHPFFA
jgi:hypothetical protein